MNGYSNDEIFTPDERRAFLAAEELVKRLPDYDAKGDRLRCHEVVRLVSYAMTPIIHGEWDVVDGHFATVEHSWLVSRTRAKSLAGYERGTILDCYTVARLPMVQLLSRSVHFHDVLVGAFRPGGPRGDIRADVMTSEFIQQVIVARSAHGGGIADAIRTAVAYATHLERSEEAPWSREPDSCIEAGEAEAIRLAERVRVSNLFSTWLCLDHGGEEEARIRERILTAPREDARKEEI